MSKMEKNELKSQENYFGYLCPLVKYNSKLISNNGDVNESMNDDNEEKEDDSQSSRIPLSSSKILIGRHSACDIRVDDDDVSRFNAILYRYNEKCAQVIRLPSTSSLQINERAIDNNEFINDGDILKVNEKKFKFHLLDTPQINNLDKTYGRLIVMKGDLDGSSFPLKTTCCLIGSKNDCDIRLTSDGVADYECYIHYQQGYLPYVIKLSNETEIFVNDKKLDDITQLQSNDRIRIGNRNFRYESNMDDLKVDYTLKANEKRLNNEQSLINDEKKNGTVDCVMHEIDIDSKENEMNASVNDSAKNENKDAFTTNQTSKLIDNENCYINEDVELVEKDSKTSSNEILDHNDEDVITVGDEISDEKVNDFEKMDETDDIEDDDDDVMKIDHHREAENVEAKNSIESKIVESENIELNEVSKKGACNAEKSSTNQTSTEVEKIDESSKNTANKEEIENEKEEVEMINESELHDGHIDEKIPDTNPINENKEDTRVIDSSEFEVNEENIENESNHEQEHVGSDDDRKAEELEEADEEEDVVELEKENEIDEEKDANEVNLEEMTDSNGEENEETKVEKVIDEEKGTETDKKEEEVEEKEKSVVTSDEESLKDIEEVKETLNASIVKDMKLSDEVESKNDEREKEEEKKVKEENIEHVIENMNSDNKEELTETGDEKEEEPLTSINENNDLKVSESVGEKDNEIEKNSMKEQEKKSDEEQTIKLSSEEKEETIETSENELNKSPSREVPTKRNLRGTRSSAIKQASTRKMKQVSVRIEKMEIDNVDGKKEADNVSDNEVKSGVQIETEKEVEAAKETPVNTRASRRRAPVTEEKKRESVEKDNVGEAAKPESEIKLRTRGRPAKTPVKVAPTRTPAKRKHISREAQEDDADEHVTEEIKEDEQEKRKEKSEEEEEGDSKKSKARTTRSTRQSPAVKNTEPKTPSKRSRKTKSEKAEEGTAEKKYNLRSRR